MRIFPFLLNTRREEQLKRIQHGTLASRMINPELYIKPNRTLINFGVAALAGCVMYLVFMVATYDSKDKKKKTKKTFSTDTGKTSTKSKWD